MLPVFPSVFVARRYNTEGLLLVTWHRLSRLLRQLPLALIPNPFRMMRDFPPALFKFLNELPLLPLLSLLFHYQ